MPSASRIVAFFNACLRGRATFLNFGDSHGHGAKPDPNLFGFHPENSRRHGSRRWLGLALGGLLSDQSAHVHLDGGLLAATDIEDGQGCNGAPLEDGRRKLIEIRDETAIDADEGIARLHSRCKIDPPAAAVEVEGGAAGAWPGAASAGGSGSLGTRFWATMPAWSNQSGKAPSQPPCARG